MTEKISQFFSYVFHNHFRFDMSYGKRRNLVFQGIVLQILSLIRFLTIASLSILRSTISNHFANQRRVPTNVKKNNKESLHRLFRLRTTNLRTLKLVFCISLKTMEILFWINSRQVKVVFPMRNLSDFNPNQTEGVVGGGGGERNGPS